MQFNKAKTSLQRNQIPLRVSIPAKNQQNSGKNALPEKALVRPSTSLNKATQRIKSPQVPEPVVVMLTTTEILNKVEEISKSEENFDQKWGLFVQTVSNYFKFNWVFFMEHINSKGEELMKEGSFILSWIKILESNCFLNMPILAKNISENYLPKVENNKSILESYLQTKTIQEISTPIKNLKASSLKKSKNSTSKKVQFGQDEIIYPILEDYCSSMISPKEQIIQKIKSEKHYILNYFQISQIYLLSEVNIVAILKEYQDEFCILLVKKKQDGGQDGEEFICIGVFGPESNRGYNIKNLQEIERNYSNLKYLDLEGKKSEDAWNDLIFG